MAPLPDLASTLRVSLVHTYGADTDVVTRFFIKYASTAPTAAQLNTFCTAIGTAWGTNLKALCATEVVLTVVDAVDLTTTSSPIGAATPGIIGTRAGTALPASVAAVVSYEIARRYRGGHPRGYWPFGVAADVGAAVPNWQAGPLAAFQTGIDAFFTAVLAAGWTGAGALSHVNASYFHSFTVVLNPTTGRARNVPTLRGGGPVTDAVTSRIARARMGTQRRRIAP